MPRFPVDAPKARVLKTLELFGFRLVRAGEHNAMTRESADGKWTPLTPPNHCHIKGSTLRTLCSQAGISRDEFLRAYDQT